METPIDLLMNKQTVAFCGVQDQTGNLKIDRTLRHGWGQDRPGTRNLLEMFIKFLCWPIRYVTAGYVIQIPLCHIMPVKL